MNYLVLVKQVPDTKSIQTDEKTGSLLRDSVGSVPNQDDKDAILMAKFVSERFGGDFCAMTMGPKQARACLRNAMGFGAVNGYHISDSAFSGSDVLITAKTLKLAIEKLSQKPDIIFAGHKSSDSDTGHLPAQLASMLGYSVVSRVTQIEKITEDKIVLKNIANGIQNIVSVKLPAVISVEPKIFKNVFPSMRDMLIARKKELIKFSFDDIDGDRKNFGYSASPSKLKKLKSITSVREKKIIESFELARDIPNIFKMTEMPLENSSKKESVKVKDGLKLLVFAVDLYDRTPMEISSYFYRISENIKVKLLTFEKETKIALGFFDEIVKFEAHEKAFSHHGYAEVLINYLNNEKADFVLIPATDTGSLIASITASRLETGLTADCTDFKIEDNILVATRPAYDERLLAEIVIPEKKPQMATVRPGIFEECNFKRDTKLLEICTELFGDPIELLGEEKIKRNAQSEKDILFVIGNGVKTKAEIEFIKKVANEFNASVSCTRAMVMGMLMDHQLQLGVSGYVSKAKLALLIGVSGASQTMAGLKRVNKVIAINSDPSAPVFGDSDLGVVEDWKKIFKYNEKGKD